MDRTKFDITVMALFGGGVNEKFLARDIRLINCHKRSFPGNSHVMKLFSPSQLYRFYIREHYDIIVSYLEGPSARIVSGCGDPNTKLISWIHIEQKTRDNAARSFRSYNEAVRCYTRFHQTVCVSETVKEDFSSLFPMVKNLTVCYNTNDTAQILAAAKKSPGNFPLDAALFNLVGIGKITPTKGFDRLARIHQRLIKDGLNIHTYILGVGPQQKELEAYLQEHNLTDSFTFLGYQTNPYQYLSKCDLFVCASHAEGFSTAATEALICGVPVVTTEVSGMKEMLGQNNEWGIVTDNNEEALYAEIHHLLTQPELLCEYKAKAQQRGLDFHSHATIDAAQSIFLSL